MGVSQKAYQIKRFLGAYLFISLIVKDTDHRPKKPLVKKILTALRMFFEGEGNSPD